MTAAADTPTRTRFLVWGVGVLAYVVAVFHRFSLGVAGLEAEHRFGVTAATLGVFSVLQLAVYAGMQIPAGVLLDRYGSKRLLITGALLMATAQTVFAAADDLRTALLARVLLGLGDAVTFISVLRLVTVWFPPRLNPLMTQLTGLVGQLGAVLSAIPLIHVLHGAGWTPTFAGAAAVGVLVSLLVVLAVRDAPYGRPAQPRARFAEVRTRLRSAWHEPGTRLGLWTHFVTQFPGAVFALLWGYPFLVSQGVTPAGAGLLLTMLTVAGMACGPVLGHLVGRHPFHRSWLVLGVVAVSVSAWTAVLLWPGPAPYWLLVLLVLALASNGPASMIGFDYARTFNPAPRLGSASGIVNVGGFVASLVVILLIGLVVTTLGSFTWAFTVQYPIWALGVLQVLRYRRDSRRALRARDPEAYDALRAGIVVPVPA
jgi:MFS family permease